MKTQFRKFHSEAPLVRKFNWLQLQHQAYHGWRYTLVLLNRCPKPDVLTFNGSLGRWMRWIQGLQLLQEMRIGEVQPESQQILIPKLIVCSY